ncbi:MFS transporter [Povalibacter sp.]|uniref:MFS transporter n=1 Tax=Povalibacter sp. TaxID=1962978 RepID=UPI002F41E98C
MKPLKKDVVAWALYDWGNSAFAATVMVVFFPVFFKQYWSADVSATESTFWLGMVNGIASFLLAIMAPLLGTLGDRGGSRLKFLLGFTVLGVLSTAGLGLVAQGQWQWAALLFALGSMGFWGGIIFYDSLLIDVAPRDRLDSISGFGYAIGYMGGGVLLAINVWMTLDPAFFGFADATEAVKASFISAAVWWALFAIPIFLFVRERPAPQRNPARSTLRQSFAELAATVREVRKYRAIVFFLLAYWMYIDGVNTIQKMAVDYGLAIGLESSRLIQAILMVQFIGFPAALLFGWIGQRLSPVLGIFICIAVYAVVTIYATMLNTVTEFFIMAAATGCVQGGIQSLSRSYYGSLIPPDRTGEFFGFYNMMSKFAAVLGPFLMGITALLTGNSRTAILSIVVLFIAGGALLVVAAKQKKQDFTQSTQRTQS